MQFVLSRCTTNVTHKKNIYVNISLTFKDCDQNYWDTFMDLMVKHRFNTVYQGIKPYDRFEQYLVFSSIIHNYHRRLLLYQLRLGFGIIQPEQYILINPMSEKV